MATYTTSDFKPGLKFMQDGEPCVIVENEFVKPGKGQAFLVLVFVINFRQSIRRKLQIWYFG